MAKKTANIMVRIEPEVKAEAEAVLEDLGISLSAAVNMLFKQIIRTGGIPFEINSRREGIPISQDEAVRAAEESEIIIEDSAEVTPEDSVSDDMPIGGDFSFPENVSKILTVINR